MAANLPMAPALLACVCTISGLNFLMSFLTIFMFSTFSLADELSGEAKILNLQERVAQMPKTIVVRIKSDPEQTPNTSQAEQVEVLFHGEKLSADVETQNLIKDAAFQIVKAQPYNEKDELNRDSSQSAWYFGLYYNPYAYSWWNYFTPTVWYGGMSYAYSPYYTGYWGGYRYSYYSNCSWYRYCW